MLSMRLGPDCFCSCWTQSPAFNETWIFSSTEARMRQSQPSLLPTGERELSIALCSSLLLWQVDNLNSLLATPSWSISGVSKQRQILNSIWQDASKHLAKKSRQCPDPHGAAPSLGIKGPWKHQSGLPEVIFFVEKDRRRFMSSVEWLLECQWCKQP